MAGTAVVWVAEGTWPACIDAARAWVPEGDDIVLLHVAGGEVTAAHGALAGLLGRGRLLTVAGWGHTSLFLSSCADAYVSRYLLTGRVPPKGTVCDVDVVPFSQPASAAATAEVSAHAYLLPPTLKQAHQV